LGREPGLPLWRGLVHFHGARRGRQGLPCIYPHVVVQRFWVGIHLGPWEGPRGIPYISLHVPVCRSQIGRRRCHRGVPWGGTLRWRGRSRLCWGIPT